MYIFHEQGYILIEDAEIMLMHRTNYKANLLKYK